VARIDSDDHPIAAFDADGRLTKIPGDGVGPRYWLTRLTYPAGRAFWHPDVGQPSDDLRGHWDDDSAHLEQRLRKLPPDWL
jgi:hypothetical protein